MPLCFAYGSNMDGGAMARRCPKSRAIGPARLMRHRFAVMPEGFANVVRDPRAVVHGVLWDIALADMRGLDAYERVAQGLYSKALQPVVKSGGGSARALVYIGQGEGGRPAPDYIRGIVAAARGWGLPEAYARMLQSFAPPIPREAPEPHKVQTRYASPLDR